MTTSKIKIKLGAIEVEYEGSESFLKEELPALLAAVSDLYQRSHASLQPVPVSSTPASAASTSLESPRLQATTGSIAARLQVKSGPELIMAAAARLTFSERMNSFSRQRLTDEMKTASAYFKSTYVNNLSKYLHSLVKDGKLNEPSQGNFALTANSLKELEPRIA